MYSDRFASTGGCLVSGIYSQLTPGSGALGSRIQSCHPPFTGLPGVLLLISAGGGGGGGGLYFTHPVLRVSRAGCSGIQRHSVLFSSKNIRLMALFINVSSQQDFTFLFHFYFLVFHIIFCHHPPLLPSKNVVEKGECFPFL
jgi:hypothetical protein